MAKWLAVLILLAGNSSAVFGQEAKAPPQSPSWGSVSGRVVFDGDLQDPALRPYQDDVKLYELRTMQQQARGVKPRVIGQVPNHALLIDPKTRGVKNVFVYLKKRPEQVHPSLADRALKPVEVVCRDHLFSPRAALVEVGQKAQMLSPDNATDFGGSFSQNPSIDPLVKPGEPAEWVPEKAERLPIRIWSHIDQAAVSYWLTLDHPYAAITGPDGEFRLENLPVGDHELVVWQESVGYLEKKLPITVRAEEAQELSALKITAEKLKPLK